MATSIKLTDELKNRIQQLAQLKQRSPHWIMCEAIRTYVDHEAAHEHFKQEALNSWTAFQETGKHLTGNEVSDWLNTWGTDEEKEMPECHE